MVTSLLHYHLLQVVAEPVLDFSMLVHVDEQGADVFVGLYHAHASFGTHGNARSGIGVGVGSVAGVCGVPHVIVGTGQVLPIVRVRVLAVVVEFGALVA